jgi:hydrophobic/amphiphilic exporter-1 (mainly G- bacteria), HAE1 family
MLIVIASGLYSGLQMKMETIPNINIPFVSITTTYPGAPPEEVDKEITEPIEKQLKNLSGVKVVSSTSLQNASIIEIEYHYKENMDKAETEAKEAINTLHLPDGANEPIVSRESFDAFPVLALSVTNKDQNLSALTDLAKNNIVPVLESIEGVASVQLSGQQIQEIDIAFDDKRLAEHGLDKDTVTNYIKNSAVSIPLGIYQFKNKEKTVIVDGNITSLKALKDLEIPLTNHTGFRPSSNIPTQGRVSGHPVSVDPVVSKGIPAVKLDDIAEVTLVSKTESISRTNGVESIGVQVIKATDANTVEVVDRVKETLKNLQNKYKGLHVITSFDQGKPIQESVNTMFSKAIFGAIFAALIIMLFLRNFRTTIISIISIPLSLLMTILILRQLDITLNIMTLGAMTVAIGRVIDDSIVVIENIYRRMSLPHEKLKDAMLIRVAAKEMFLPIMSSTIVTVAVFLPIGFVQGAVGELFMPFALTIVFSLSASLLIAITVVPMLTHTLFKNGWQKKGLQTKPEKLSNIYRHVLSWSLNHKLFTFGAATLLLMGSLFIVPLLGVSFLPSDEQKMIVATYTPAPAETKHEVEQAAKMAEDYFQSRKGVKNIQYSIGIENPMDPTASNQTLFFVEYDKNTADFRHEQVKVLNALKSETGQGKWGTMDISSTGGNSLKLFVYGDNLKDISTSVQKITRLMKADPSFMDVKSGFSRALDQYTLVADHSKLSQYGLTAGQIGMALSSVGQRPVLTTIKNGSEKINVYVEDHHENYNDVSDLTKTEIKSPLGAKVALGDVVTIKKDKAPVIITKRDGKLYTTITAKMTSNNVGKASNDLQKRIDKTRLPDGSFVEFGGVTKQMNDSFHQLKLAMLAAIVIVYFILVVTFGNGLAPFAILFSLPFSLIGGCLALYFSRETLSVSAMIGALMLIGIVVANAIVLIDRVTHKEKEGLTTREALLEAAGTRLRPILMTAIATIGALIPLVFGMEGGGLISRGLAVTVIGGLASSTLLTLFIVPIVYEFLMKFHKKNHPFKTDIDNSV